MRYAMKVFYDGKNFYGSQVQPNRRTVEGELIKALAVFGKPVENFMGAGRTDRGVSALGNVYAVTTEAPLKPRAINNHLPPDIRVLAVKEVGHDFKPRKEAIEREYKYYLLKGDLDVGAMDRASEGFEGDKCFHNFCKTSDRSTTRKLSRVGIRESDGFLVISYVGGSFLWQMARRITTALIMIGKGEIEIDDLQRYFDPKFKEKMPPAPPGSLVLWDVRYPFELEPEDYSMKKIIGDHEACLQETMTNLEMGKSILGGLREL